MHRNRDSPLLPCLPNFSLYRGRKVFEQFSYNQLKIEEFAGDFIFVIWSVFTQSFERKD